MLFNLVIAPIETLIDYLFSFILNRMSNVGIIGAIFGVSVFVNFLALPLYNVAEAIQKRERETVKKLAARVAKIKKAFRSDERFMMLQTYYRQNNYHPLYALRSSLSILIEIPFFIAAYHYLSHSEILNGASFGFIKNLGKADGLLKIHAGGHSFAVNVLPLVMTAINIASSFIYTKDATKGEKAQLYILSLIFLVLLYNSPSGLVIYWILNNAFSFAKNIVSRMKHSRLISYLAICFITLQVPIYLAKSGFTARKFILTAFIVVCLLIPPFIYAAKKYFLKEKINALSTSKDEWKNDFLLFVFSSIALSLFTGLVLPASTISTSPIEFSFIGNTPSPLSYVGTSLSIFCGFFFLWPLAIYFLFGDKVKRTLSLIMPLLFMLALANTYIFKIDTKTVDVTFTLGKSKGLQVPSIPILFMQLALLAVFAAALYVLKRKKNILSLTFFAFALASAAYGATKAHFIYSSFRAHKANLAKAKTRPSSERDSAKINPVFHLTKKGKNVIVLFLDRAISSFLESAFLDLPELKEGLRGFTFYPETLSFGPCTVLASPQLLAGYEYTPEKINARKDELLKDKHNEALLVMPTLFAEGGFHATFVNPPFVNYHWRGDLDIFNGRKNIRVFENNEVFANLFKIEHSLMPHEDLDKDVRKGLKNFIFVQILPQIARIPFYKFCTQKASNNTLYYLDEFPALYYFDKLTDFTAGGNQFFLIDNETTHEPTFLKDDFETPAATEAERAKTHFQCEDENVMQHYHVFLASMKALARYFDYLRKNDCFDNTRFIIVSDHGRDLSLPRFSHFKEIPASVPSSFNPLFMMKDFNSNEEFKTDNRFMTNADTILLAKKDLPLSDKNPLTGVEFRAEKEGGITCYEVYGKEWNGETMRSRKQTTLLKEKGYHVEGDIFDEESWTPLTKFSNGGKK